MPPPPPPPLQWIARHEAFTTSARSLRSAAGDFSYHNDVGSSPPPGHLHGRLDDLREGGSDAELGLGLGLVRKVEHTRIFAVPGEHRAGGPVLAIEHGEVLRK